MCAACLNTRLWYQQGRRCERKGGCRAECRWRSSLEPNEESRSWRSEPWRALQKTWGGKRADSGEQWGKSTENEPMRILLNEYGERRRAGRVENSKQRDGKRRDNISLWNASFNSSLHYWTLWIKGWKPRNVFKKVSYFWIEEKHLVHINI